MEQDNSELIEYLDKKFTGIDQQFLGIDKKFTGIDQQFLGIKGNFERVYGELNDIHEEIAELKDGFNNLQNAVDAYAMKADSFFQEMVMLSHKVDRHERWIQQIADKLGVKLDY
jgi:uncharacterized coiled-coil DUF342 family protein